MIADHQDLLNRFYTAERGCISEYSGQIQRDTEELNREVNEYAEKNGLESPVEE